MTQKERADAFTNEIWRWYDSHKRELPWRDLKIQNRNERAYRILVSEVMLQQTQVNRVIIIYKRFLDQFPKLKDLAQASNKEVILAWRGMGYNSRALRLRDAANTIFVQKKGVFPEEMSDLLSIKGIGPYTAGAIRNFAFGLPTPCIDTNIRRVLHRVFYGNENADGTWEKSDKELLRLAGEVLEAALGNSPTYAKASVGRQLPTSKNQPGRTTADWHAALMDFGSMVQTKNNPKWELCPLTKKGIMKAKPGLHVKTLRRSVSTEPGRYVGTKYIPNRIFRGKVIEELRDNHSGLTLSQIGQRVCLDWDASEHTEWLSSLVEKLKKDALVGQRGKVFVLKE